MATVAVLFLGAKCQTVQNPDPIAAALVDADLQDRTVRNPDAIELAIQGANVEGRIDQKKKELADVEKKIRQAEADVVTGGIDALLGDADQHTRGDTWGKLTAGGRKVAGAGQAAVAATTLKNLQKQKKKLEKDLAKLEKEQDSIEEDSHLRDHSRDVASANIRDTQRGAARQARPPKPKVEKVKPKVEKPAKPHCFVAGTVVHTPNGPCEIQDIRVGDAVTTYNAEKQRIGPASVTARVRGERDDLVEIESAEGILLCSPNHHFFVSDRSWRRAQELGASAVFMALGGDGTRIEERSVTIRARNTSGPVAVYNLTIRENRNFFVGPDRILCHNTPTPGGK